MSSQVVPASIRSTDQKNKGAGRPPEEFGLDVITSIGQRHFRECYSAAEMHQALLVHGVNFTLYSVTHLMHRYKEFVTLHVADQERIKAWL